jgi:mono/diheme cytochrome c family protein
MNFRAIALASLSAFLAFSCQDNTFKEGIIVAGERYVTAATLNKGKQIYMEYCMACHGVKGDGNGVASKGMTVPPRNFTLGLIKFGDVASGELPHDESIFHSLKKGLHGTAMLPWDLSEGQMDAVWQYIKTFAPNTWVGKDKALGEKIVAGKDPYGLARATSAFERGKEVYHAAANCQTCHRAYVSPAEFGAITKKVNGEASEADPEMYVIKLQDSDHGYKTLPPDFTWDLVRSATTVEELYVRLSAGVGGTAMPAWKGALDDSDIWALSYYVKGLMDLRNTKEREAFLKNVGMNK